MPWDAARLKAMLLSPTSVDLPECDCHLPTMESAGRIYTHSPHYIVSFVSRNHVVRAGKMSLSFSQNHDFDADFEICQ